jgi:hypothetical protein
MEKKMSEVIEKPAEKKAAAAPPAMFKVTIHSGEGEADKGDVPIIHNYKQIVIQRDKEVTINENYLNVLKDAVVNTSIKSEDGKITPIKIPRFSYTVTPA